MNSGNAVVYLINNDPTKPPEQRVHDSELECQAVGFAWSFSDYLDNVYIGTTACNGCRPRPAPTPNPGTCGGSADLTTFPTTGCSVGLTPVDDWCDLSLAEQETCNGPTFYDYNTCTCPDGATPPCSFQEDEKPWQIPNSYGQLDCSLCRDSVDNDCDSATDEYDADCAYVCAPSPIVIDTLGNGFGLTGPSNGVDFDIRGVGRTVRISWIQGDDAWLALDRNGNGAIDSGAELFGNITYQLSSPERNGFLALGVYDEAANGGNSDGVITNQDTIFPSLRLWFDSNRNGVSEQSELQPLASNGIAKLELDYKLSKRTDANGNEFRYRAKLKGVNGAQLGRWAWDVFLTSETQTSRTENIFVPDVLASSRNVFRLKKSGCGARLPV